VIRGHLGNIRILAKAAFKIAAHGGNRIRKGPRQEMKKGFFFNGINMSGNYLAVHQCL
jgi:hypothetical protein